MNKKNMILVSVLVLVAVSCMFLYKLQTSKKQEMAGNVPAEQLDYAQQQVGEKSDEINMVENVVKDPVEKEDAKKEEEKPKVEESAKITLSAKEADGGVKLSWDLQNISGFEGFKVVKSETANPTYPGCPYNYLAGTSMRSFVWDIADGKKYHFRVCAYAGGKCLAYSNDVYLQTSGEKSGEGDKDYATDVSLNASKDGDSAKLTWSISGGSAPLGFKVVSSKKKNPEYPTRSGDEYQYLSDSSVRKYTWKNFSKGETYHFRVCIYKGGSCGAYSNDVEVAF